MGFGLFGGGAALLDAYLCSLSFVCVFGVMRVGLCGYIIVFECDSCFVDACKPGQELLVAVFLGWILRFAKVRSYYLFTVFMVGWLVGACCLVELCLF